MSDTQPNTLPHKRTIIASTLAIILEWYSFSIFGFYAIILSKLFFPFADETTAVLSTFMIFALSFLFRPLGSVVIGSIGDRFGRKNAFILTVIFMTFPTVLIGLLPLIKGDNCDSTVNSSADRSSAICRRRTLGNTFSFYRACPA